MKSNINKLILIEVIAGILLAFIASKILHMTEALQIMYLPFELIGKGLRVLSLSSAIGNAHHTACSPPSLESMKPFQ